MFQGSRWWKHAWFCNCKTWRAATQRTVLQICMKCVSVLIYGSNMVFHALTFARSRWRCWKPWPEAAVFNTSQGTWRMLMHLTMFDRYYWIKTQNICYISRYFLHYFVSAFHRWLTNAISTDYARSRTGQYTSRNGSKSVAPVRTYWKLRSRALTQCELPCYINVIHGFSPINARLFINCDTAFYAIIWHKNSMYKCFF